MYSYLGEEEEGRDDRRHGNGFFVENWLYYCGDTFRFWTGPRPSPDEPHSSEIHRQIREGFISNNLIKECVDRNVAAMIGMIPQWFLYSGTDASDGSEVNPVPSEQRSPPIINRDIKRLQNAINKALTMLGRNLDLAGFLERVITNAQTPGEWVYDANRPGKQRFVPDNQGLRMGAGKTTFLSGIKLDENNYTTPAITYRDPVDITTFEKSVALFAARLYLAFNQGHSDRST